MPAKKIDAPDTKAKTAPKTTKAVKATSSPKTPKVPAQATTGRKPRRYYAGVVLKKHGIDKGVTPAMIAEVNKLFGVVNDRESMAILRNGIHMICGYEIHGKK